jgi:copper chaperone CopZ
MKSILAMATAILLLVSCKEKTNESVSIVSTEKNGSKVKMEIESTNLQEASFKIEGMTCAIGCAKTIEEELNGLDGVKTAKVNFETKLASISFDKTLLTPEIITKVVQATGDGKTYKVSDMK